MWVNGELVGWLPDGYPQKGGPAAGVTVKYVFPWGSHFPTHISVTTYQTTSHSDIAMLECFPRPKRSLYSKSFPLEFPYEVCACCMHFHYTIVATIQYSHNMHASWASGAIIQVAILHLLLARCCHCSWCSCLLCSCFMLLLCVTAAIMYITTAVWILELLQFCYYAYFNLNS